MRWLKFSIKYKNGKKRQSNFSRNQIWGKKKGHRLDRAKEKRERELEIERAPSRLKRRAHIGVFLSVYW